MKYGLISYDYTTNLGNEIQSIAARRFLPNVDYYIEHEKLDKFDEDYVKMIMNGWFVDCPTAWPPSQKIDPLLVSMHFTTTTKNKKRIEAILTPESKDFFKEHGPVGCRDMHTVDFLNENGIEAYFTGCLTLTLDSGDKKPLKDEDNDYIVVNMDDSDELLSFLRHKTDKKIYLIQQDMMPSFKKAFPGQMPKWLYNLTSFYDSTEKFFMAENLLKIYENASCVITDRLHCALPCLALKTPVMLFNQRGMKERFDGISNLLLESNLEEYKSNYKIFDVENPPQNSDDYQKIRKDLIKKCEDFTGHINDSCYLDISYNELMDKNSLILSRNAMETRNYLKEVIKYHEKEQRKSNKTISKQKEEIKSLKSELEKQKEELEKYKSPKSDSSSIKKVKNKLFKR